MHKTANDPDSHLRAVEQVSLGGLEGSLKNRVV